MVGNISVYFPFHFVVVQSQVDAGDLLKLKKTDDGDDILVVPTSGRISLARFDAYASMLIICEPWQTSHSATEGGVAWLGEELYEYKHHSFT